MGNSSSSSLPPLQHVSSCITERFMGAWFVIAVKPTIFEKTNSNAVEIYTRPKGKSYDIDIDFSYNSGEPIESKLKRMPQKGWVGGDDKEDSGLWTVSPTWPIKFPYPIIELDDKDYTYVVVGYPNRDYCWVMARKPQMPESTYEMLTQRLVEKHQYSMDGFRKVPQVWTAEEREKRGLTSKEIPDDMLVKSYAGI